MAYTVAMAVFIFAFWHSPNIAWVQWLAVAAVGAALYGPQVRKDDVMNTYLVLAVSGVLSAMISY